MINLGSLTLSKIYNGENEIKKAYAGENLIYNSEPTVRTYQQLTFLNFNSHSRLELEHYANNNTAVEMKVSPVSVGGNGCLWCSRQAFSTTTYSCFFLTTHLRFDYNATLTQDSTTTISANTEYVVKGDKNRLYINGELLITQTETTFTSPYKLWIGASYTGSYGSVANWLNARVYYCKVWDNDTLVYDLVPVKRLEDSVYGFYDILNKEFYLNTGTGTWLAGEELDIYY